MAQAIVCYNREGLVLASDSLMVQEAPGNRVTRLTGRRLFALGSHAVLLAAGAPVAAEVGEALAAWLQARGLDDLGDVLAVSPDFLSEGYARFLRGSSPPEARPRHLYFIIGGCPSDRASGEGSVLLLHSEAGELPFREARLGRVFSLPRRVALEGRLTRRIAEGASLDELAGICWAALEGAAQRNPEAVGGPFLLATITAAGVRFLDEPPAEGGE